MTREKMEFDVLIVGAGPAGLAASIRLAQLAKQNNTALTIGVLDKGASVGSHIISGAVFDPSALQELFPDWQQLNAPLLTPVSQDKFMYLTATTSLRLPTPPQMRNHGNYIISLGKLCRWLARQAEDLGVHIFPGFAATDIIYADNCVRGVITGEKGLDRTGLATGRYQAGMELYAKQTLFAEGAHGSLTKKLCEQFALRAASDPQTYSLGLKEVWEVPAGLNEPGLVIHTVGYPLDDTTYGGGFIYHFENNLMALGLIVGLDYKNPFLNPYEELQRFKTHPQLSPLLAQSKRLAYGARVLNEGGWQALPTMVFPGGLLLGCAAGLLNPAQLKGIHNALRSGMVAAASLYPVLPQLGTQPCTDYPANLRKTKLWHDLYKARNIRPAMRWGLWPGLLYAAVDTYLLRGRAPWTLHHRADHLQLQPAASCNPMRYPPHDNKIFFDLATSLYLANINYPEKQPNHLLLTRHEHAISINLARYAAPEQRYCPAGVYEIITTPNDIPQLQINSGNCIHCKACDIKDPSQNITWTPPEGGSGPQYEIL